MSVFYNVFNTYQVFVNTLKHNIFKIKNENEIPVDINISTQFMEQSQKTEPCRSCTDFRTFSRMRRQEFSQNQVLVCLFSILSHCLSFTDLFKTIWCFQQTFVVVFILIKKNVIFFTNISYHYKMVTFT